MDDKVIKEINVYIRPHTDVKLFRLPANLSSKSVAVVKMKPENKVVQLETFQRKNSESQTYTSRLMANHTPLAVAVMENDSLFLTRVSEVYELKPQFKLPDTSKSPVRSNETSSDDEKVSAVTMRFASANEDDKRKARESLYSYHQEKIDRENWIEMDFENEKSDRAKEALKSLGRI